MTVFAHIDALHEKHAKLEEEIKQERLHALPDFARISEMKKHKLKIKEELAMLDDHVPKHAQA